MRFLAGLLFVSLLITGVSADQLLLMGAGTPKHAGGGGYSGPGDVVSGAIGWWGLRCYNASKASLASAATIRRASDNATQTIGLTAACNLDVATATTFCNATTCWLATLYDQAGTNNMTQAVAASQPQLIFNCIGTLPCMKFVPSQVMATVSAITQAQPFTVPVVGMRNGNFTALGDYVGASSANIQMGPFNTANNAFLYAGSAPSFAATDSAWHAFSFIFNTTSSIIGVDGTYSGSLSPGSNTYASYNVDLGGSGNALTGEITEAGLWSGAFTTGASSQATNMCHNQYLYWGTSTSC
jgi:hypothetical protein